MISERPYDKGNRGLILLILYLILYYPAIGFGLSFTIGMGLFAILTIATIVLRQGEITCFIYKPSKQWLFLCIVVLIMLCLPYARRELLTTGMHVILLFFFLIYILVTKTSEKEIVAASNILLYYGLIIALYIIFVKLFPDIYTSNIMPYLRGLDKSEILYDMRRGYGVQIGGSAIYGDYILLISAIIGIAKIFTENKTSVKRKLILLEIIFSIAVLIEGRRGEMISYSVTLFVIILMLPKRYTANRILKRAIEVITLCVVGYMILSYMIKNDMLERYLISIQKLLLNRDSNTINDVSAGRYILWKEAIQRFFSSPIIGIGWGRFKDYVPYPFKGTINNVHNTYLQFLCETGIIGTLVLLYPIMSIFINSRKKMKSLLLANYEYNRVAIISMIISFGIQLFFLIESIFDPCFYSSIYAVMMAISIVLLNYNLISSNYNETYKRI